MNQVRCSRYCSLTLKILILLSHLERYHVKTESAESCFYLPVVRKNKKVKTYYLNRLFRLSAKFMDEGVPSGKVVTTDESAMKGCFENLQVVQKFNEVQPLFFESSTLKTLLHSVETDKQFFFLSLIVLESTGDRKVSQQAYMMLILESKSTAPLKFRMIISEATLSDICTMAAPSLLVRNLT